MKDRSVDEVVARLRGHLRPDQISIHPVERLVYGYDATWAEGVPDVVVHAESTADVAEVLRIADELEMPVVPRGGGTGLAGGSVPMVGGICLNLARMNRILEVDPVDGVAVVQPGVITYELQKAVEAHGWFYPPDPASLYMSTIGGNVATNAGGPRCLKYGVTRDYVLGMEVVLPGGEVLRLGGRVMKDVSGYDLKHLFIGSEGTLGVITEVTVRLLPRPPALGALAVAFDHLESACEAVVAILSSGVLPLMAELMDQGVMRAVEAFHPYGLPVEAEALLLLAADGEEEAVRRDLARMAREVQAFGGRVVRIATDAESATHLWEPRRQVSPAIARLATHKFSEDITVPRSRIPQMIRHIQQIAQETGVPIVLYGHIGDGNLHPTLLCDRRNPDEMNRVAQAATRIFQAAIELGGVLSGEHGIGLLKLDFVSQAFPPIAIEKFWAVKLLFDPKNIMNPGKKLPLPRNWS
ncbi:FAD-binding oxidoreductase [Thermoflexus sp.]|uniref:FAD-binding oxidoreductase n=1 Tax=Thermoflexus sp. TaxID=1969742 RepID=UPI0017606BD4|nr:FAD-linked oxidase C-terminal domain-containing protein [Thermoflexus sp.]